MSFLRKAIPLCVVAVLCSRFSLHSALAEPEFARVYAKVKPSVTYVVAATAHGAQSGSGFIYESDSKGSIVVTADHVIEDSTRVDVVLDSDTARRYAATILEHNRRIDVAFLKIDAPNRTPLVMAERSQIAEGNSIATIGYPRAAKVFENLESDSLRPSVHMGIVSALRVNGSILQIDAQIDHGDSGGPVVDAGTGRVVGIVDGSLSDPSFASLGLEKPLPGSGFAVSATQIYAVRNGLVQDQSNNSVVVATAAAAGTNSASYRVAFASQKGLNDVAQGVLDALTGRVREHFTGDNSFYAIPSSALILGQDSSKIAGYCDDFRVNAIVVPYFQWSLASDRAGTTKTRSSLFVVDCHGVPFYVGSREKSESRLFVSSHSSAREVTDMQNDLVDQLLQDFDSFKASHDAQWRNLLVRGIAADPKSPAQPALVGIIAQDHQYRVWHLREEGLGFRAGMREGDVIISIDGTAIPKSTQAFEVSQLIEAAKLVIVKRPEGEATIKLRP